MGEIKVSSATASDMSAMCKSTKQNRLSCKHRAKTNNIDNTESNGSLVNGSKANGCMCKSSSSSRHVRRFFKVKIKACYTITKPHKHTRTTTNSVNIIDGSNNNSSHYNYSKNKNSANKINKNIDNCSENDNKGLGNCCIPPQHVIRGVKPSSHIIYNHNISSSNTNSYCNENINNSNINNESNINSIVRTRASPPFVGRGETPSVSRRSRSPQQVMLSSEIHEYLNKIIHSRVSCEVDDRSDDNNKKVSDDVIVDTDANVDNNNSYTCNDADNNNDDNKINVNVLQDKF